MLKRAYIITISLILTIGLFIVVFVPQIPVLLKEGFPKAEWPAAGDFVRVPGNPQKILIPSGTKPALPVQERFRIQEGRALLVLRNGALSTELYGDGYDRDDLLNSYSLVKSLIGILILKALADEKIRSLDDSLTVYLGSDTPDVTIRETLMMTSGLILDSKPEKPMADGSFSPFGGVARLHAFGPDRITSKLKPDSDIRGQFIYGSVNTALLGRLLEVVYNAPLPQILSREIWRPSGAATAYWRSYPGTEDVSAYCCLYARPIDWALVGHYLMTNGLNTPPFLPQKLWQEFFAPQLPPEIRRVGVYGFHIRHDILDREGEAIQGPFSYFFGHNGQIVYFLPQKNTIVIRFGAKAQLLHTTLYELFQLDSG